MPPPTPSGQRFRLRTHDRDHLVEIVPAGLGRRITWHVDGVLVAERKSSDEKVQLTPADDPDLGAIAARFTMLGRPRRVTWFESGGDVGAGARAAIGVGSVDLVPEPGSPAARREEGIRRHPRRYAVTQTALGVAKVVVPLVLAVLFARLSFALPFPHPDLPDLPWPDLPRLPRPDWDLPDLPGWIRAVLSKAKYVAPVVLAYLLARAEIRRRRRQDELRADREEETD